MSQESNEDLESEESEEQESKGEKELNMNNNNEEQQLKKELSINIDLQKSIEEKELSINNKEEKSKEEKKSSINEEKQKSIIEKTLFLLATYIRGSEIAFDIAHDKKCSFGHSSVVLETYLIFSKYPDLQPSSSLADFPTESLKAVKIIDTFSQSFGVTGLPSKNTTEEKYSKMSLLEYKNRTEGE